MLVVAPAVQEGRPVTFPSGSLASVGRQPDPLSGWFSCVTFWGLVRTPSSRDPPPPQTDLVKPQRGAAGGVHTPAGGDTSVGEPPLLAETEGRESGSRGLRLQEEEAGSRGLGASPQPSRAQRCVSHHVLSDFFVFPKCSQPICLFGPWKEFIFILNINILEFCRQRKLFSCFNHITNEAP